MGVIGLVAQNQVGINQSSVDASAVFEVFSTDKGILVPRMNSTSRRTIVTPANGLFLFETNTRTFWYYSNSDWSEIISDNGVQDGIGDADTDTRIFLEYTVDNDQVRFYQAGVERFRMNDTRFEVRNSGNSVYLGDSAGYFNDQTNNLNTFIGASSGLQTNASRRGIGVGYQTLRDTDTGTDNVAVGSYASRSTTSGRRNIAVGVNCLLNNQTASSLTTIGHHAFENHTSQNLSIAIGNYSLQNDISGASVTAIGTRTLYSNTTANLSTAIGFEAGYLSNTNNNIYIGYRAGAQNTVADQLFIANSNTATPLLAGDFGSNTLTINGSLRVSDNITYVGNITDVSDRRLKKNIKEVKGSLKKLVQLNGYRYQLKNKAENKKEYGLIAQEVQQIYPSLSRYVDLDKKYFGVSYVQFIPLIQEAEKEQYKQLESLGEKIDSHNGGLNELEQELALIKAKLAAQAAN